MLLYICVFLVLCCRTVTMALYKYINPWDSERIVFSSQSHSDRRRESFSVWEAEWNTKTPPLFFYSFSNPTS